MHAWEQIQQTIEFIEEHLDEEIDMESLAKTASLSPFYYQRLFSRLVKKPVAEYIKLRRMAKATEAVLQKDKRILDIASDLGFSSHEHFSRTFKGTFGMTPDEYRKNPQTLNRMTKPELLLHYTLIDEGVPLITNGIVLEVNRREIAEPVYFTGVKKDMPIQFIDGIESGVDPLDTLWQNFHEQKQTQLGLAENNEEIGVAYPCLEEGYFSYFAGAKSIPEEVPNGFMNWELPPGKYIVCSFEAENFEALVMDALYKAQQYVYNTWMPNHNLQTQAFCAERYASHSLETTNMEIWLKLI
ncbi:AraC family transcriptional regulator [Lacrimispora algidixylanolytica]|uniref:AraC family transcriptional regulator n=1 Tax=Lacrimispora algidixylanolytica TaxID=94868 RepID=A0A419T4S8_9FIRM|nr:helix-turn-helix domain-containing protein [Lacrimispora algidixylanolytica]RKD32388.1 AraC family transcriptional regulator [Lacrimispora algidixylanolytica]